jgi:predicted ATPase/DNA-binding XRE family transcriptional regulator
MGDDQAFATMLRRQRVAAGLSQAMLAERAGLSVRGISDLERGVRQIPHPATVARLAEALGMKPAEWAALLEPRRASRPDVAQDGPIRRPAPPLPVSLTSLVGREQELAEVRGLLDGARLLTLIGAGGIGKTRLALAVAHALTAESDQSVAFAELAPLADAALVPQVLATALGVLEQPGRPLPQTLADAIGSAPTLVVLDNCEHVLAACADLTERLLRLCPGLRVLATSREPLGVAGEVMWRVPSLAVPAPEATADLERLGQAEAVRLFVERAQAAQPGFLLTEANAPAVAEVCRRLDGIPLALELAAARTRALAVEQIAARLDDRFRLLVGGSRTALPRQRTLAATLDWSFLQLDQPERILLRRLSVFAGGWSLEAAEEVGAGEPIEPTDVLDLLTGLVDKSLVLAEPEASDGAGRYRLLETIRQYAADKLLDAGEAAQTRDRHLAWAIGLAERATPNLVGHDQVRWLRQLALEHDNFRAALDWSRAQRDGEAELRLAAALGRFWHLRGRSSEGRAWLRHALDHSCRQPTAARALALNWAGRLATVNGDPDDLELLRESVAMAEQLGDPGLLALALRHLGMAAKRQGDDDAMRRALEAALSAARQAGDRREEAFALVSLGAAVKQAGDSDRAAQLLSEALRMGRQVGDAGPIGWALVVLSAIALDQGQHDEAAELVNEALAVARPMGYWAVVVAALAQRAQLARVRGDLAAARAHGRACVAAAHEVGDVGLVAAALAAYADVELQAGNDQQGLRLLAAESAWRAAQGGRRVVSIWTLPTPTPDEARARIGEAAFARAWAAGQHLTLDQAVAEVLATAEPGA